jgi:hypothetical protein
MVAHALVIALIVLFLHSCTWDGEIFEGVKRLIKPEKKISKPIYGCPICMTPWWGTLIYWIFFHSSVQDWLLTVGAAAGMSVISVVLIDIKDYCVERKKPS